MRKAYFDFSMPDSVYRSTHPCLSQSILKLILKSPAHARTFIDKNTETPAMLLGRAAHCLILEGSEVFNVRYAVAPECDKRTKEGKSKFCAFVETLQNRVVLPPDDLATINAMDTVLKTNNITRDLFINGKPEVSAFGEINGSEIKGRFDYYHQQEQIIIDLKTTVDASPEAVQKTVVNYSLHIQNYVYAELHRNITGSPPRDFVFVIVEKTPPYGICVFRMDPEALKVAELQVGRAIEIYRECVKKNTWPCYPEIVRNINLPAWYLQQFEVVL